MKLDALLCPCGDGFAFEACCYSIISGKEKARTAEQLMRSRYSAYVKEDVDYLVSTTHPDSRSPELAESIAAWMKQVQWVRLHILKTQRDRIGFMAEYIAGGKLAQYHEESVFKKYKGEWFYFGEE